MYESVRRRRPSPNGFPREGVLALLILGFFAIATFMRWWQEVALPVLVLWWERWEWAVMLTTVLILPLAGWVTFRKWRLRPRQEPPIPFGRLVSFPWSRFYLPTQTLNMHTLVIAPTGRGKTSMVLLPLGIEHLKAGHGLFAMEPKPGDLLIGLRKWAEHLGRPYLLWNPLLPGCPVFNPLHGTRIEAANRVAFALSRMRQSRNSSAGADFYQGVGRNILRHSIYALKSVLGEEAHLGHLRDFLQDASFRSRVLASCHDADALSYFTHQFNQWSQVDQQRNSAGILDMLNALLAHDLVKAALCGPNEVDLDAVYETAGVLLVGLVTGELADLAPIIGGLWWYSNQLAAFKRNSRTFFANLIDEYPDFCGEGDAKYFSQIRSYRVGVTVVVQAKAQFQHVGGQDFADILVDQCATKVVLPGLGPRDSEWASQVCGTTYRLQPVWDGAGSITSLGVIDDPRVDSTSITELPFGSAVIRTVINGQVRPPVVLRTQQLRWPSVPTR